MWLTRVLARWRTSRCPRSSPRTGRWREHAQEIEQGTFWLDAVTLLNSLIGALKFWHNMTKLIHTHYTHNLLKHFLSFSSL